MTDSVRLAAACGGGAGTLWAAVICSLIAVVALYCTFVALRRWPPWAEPAMFLAVRRERQAVESLFEEGRDLRGKLVALPPDGLRKDHYEQHIREWEQAVREWERAMLRALRACGASNDFLDTFADGPKRDLLWAVSAWRSVVLADFEWRLERVRDFLHDPP